MRNCCTSRLLRHEPLVVDPSLSRALWTPSHRLADQTNDQFAQNSTTGWVARRVFAFHDRDEIGPHMLTRLSKVTGVQPEDL